MSNKLPENAIDRLFLSSDQDLHPFKFNQSVVDVFPDMINRSVPGYQTIVDGIGRISQRFLSAGSSVYDLGSSLGNVSLTIAKHNMGKSVCIYAIDNSIAMVERCRQHVGAYNYDALIDVQQGDITKLSLRPCDMVVINFTLQFIEPAQRQSLINKVFSALNPGGVLVVSEKISVEGQIMDELLIDLHHEFKRDNGYSDLEISQKRSALEKVMILDSFETHKKRLLAAGFSDISVWFQHFNFLSFCAVKS
ncbi:carboxy-S-adenosyl-L-methionine synthase CmoA [Glaciecola sp. SC05]|uniref:carboxy-S-adenosyl-L-methionine synthase CmoA n=1 Tax=Glaciecola sp. SC05 TaxID=1987355 RepID=UPI003529D2E9